jgi:D-glycero-D-manno-heptose 1,7-bisphosphate phosphatase
MRLIILDRDGVINHDSDHFIKSPAEWIPIPGSLEAIARLNQAGAEVDAIFYCPHAADDNCDCRKPKPGMLQTIASRFGVNLKGVPNVGDSLRDLQAGYGVGCVPYLVLTGKGQRTRDKGGLPPGTLIFPDLASVVDSLLKGSTPLPVEEITPQKDGRRRQA